MSLMDNNGSNGLIMPVSPMYGGNGGGFGGFGGDWGSLIVLFLIAAMFGGFGGGFGMGGFGANLGIDFPWLMNGQQGINSNTNNGFQNALLNDNITSVRDGISNLQTQLCNSTGDIQMSLCNGFAGVEQGANTRQMANMQQAFAAQTAMNQGFNNLQSQFADCCCENRLANCQTQNVIQNEGNATRFADANNTRDILENANRNNQAILDKLCQLELDGKNDRINDLERQLTMANLQASQTAQTGRILADNAAQTVALEQYLNPVPVPAYVVQNPNCCQNNCGCGGF